MSRFAFTYEDPDYGRDEDEVPETADEEQDSYDPYDTVNS
jgi:hypothetical protein